MENEKLEKKKIKTTLNAVDDRDELVKDLADFLNKDGKVAFFLDEKEDASQILEWTSTGNSMLDLACSNRPNGGYPGGRIIELTGLESSGKSLLAGHFLAETQRDGGVAVFIDTEYAISDEFLSAIGVNTTQMVKVEQNTVEGVFDKIEAIIERVRKNEKSRKKVGIVVDSLAACSTVKELASDHGADGYATGKAIAISKAMRKITELIAKQRITILFTNQLRQKVGFVGLGDPWTTSGGKALAYHASLRIRLKPVGRITNAAKEVIGIKTRATIMKNRMGPPFRSVDFNIFFDRGVDNLGNWLENLLEWDIVTNAKKIKLEGGKKKTKKELEEEKLLDKKAKSLQTIITVEGKEPETVVFEKKDFPQLLVSRPEVKAHLYSQICEHYIMKYKNANSELVEDAEVVEGGEGLDD